MARAKRTPTKAVKKQAPEPKSRFPNFLLGLTFIIVISLLISLFFRNSGARFSPAEVVKLFTRSNSAPPTVDIKPAAQQPKAVAGEDYAVKEGDSLWMIAEEAYGSGFNSVDIAEANKLANPNQIEIGQHIILPKVEAKDPTRGEVVAQNTIQPSRAPVHVAAQTEYTVQSGDCLWNIAQKTYGDGFMWTKIAEANALSNPRVIHSGNKLILPAS